MNISDKNFFCFYCSQYTQHFDFYGTELPFSSFSKNIPKKTNANEKEFFCFAFIYSYQINESFVMERGETKWTK